MSDIDQGAGFRKQFLHRALSGAALVCGTGALLAFVAQILLARVMGVEEYGTYYYAMSWLLILGLFVRMGFDSALLRLLPVYMHNHDWNAAKGAIQFGNRLVSFAGILMGVIVASAVLWLGAKIQDSMRWTFIVAAACLPVLGLMYLRQAVLRSYKLVVRGLLPDLVIAPAALILMAAMLFVSDIALTAPLVMGLVLVSMLIAFLVGSYWQRKSRPQSLEMATARYETSAWMKFSLQLMLIYGVNLWLNQIDSVMLGLFRSTAEVGIYGVASRCAFIVAFPLTIANMVFAPLIAQMHTARKLPELQKTLATGMQLVSYASILASLVFFSFGTQILGLFGAEFTQGDMVLYTLALGQLVNSLCGPVGLLLSSTGNQTVVLRVLAVTATSNLILSLLVIPRWGMEGAAVVTAMSICCWNVVLYRQVRERIGLDASGWFPPALKRT